ncbi:MAG: DUF1217 domain-containing protein [Rhodospirillales bacterium]
MNSLVNGMNYASLFSQSTASNAPAAILAALFNPGAPSTAVSSGNPITDLKLAQSNKTAEIAREAKQPQVARDIAAFTAGVNKATSLQSALGNPNVMKVLLTANNLAGYLPYPALAQKALMSDPSASNSLVNRLGDSALLNATKTLNFAKNGLAALKNPKVTAAIADGYTEVMWRKSLDSATPGLANALTFMAQASSIDSVDAILGDHTNRTVVLTALGIPQEIAFQSLTTQEQAVAARVKISDFQKPSFVTSLTDQYLLTMQHQASSNGAGLAGFSGGLLA